MQRGRGRAGRRRPAPDRTTGPESRWPAAVGILIALVLYAALPSGFPLALRVVVVVLELLLLGPLVLLNPRRLDRETRWSRLLSVGQALLLVAANQVALGILIRALLTVDGSSGPIVLLSALQVWATNVIAFGLLFWELDRGGPVSRRLAPRAEVVAADFQFPQDQNDDAVTEVAKGSAVQADWIAGYTDYVYFSLNNSMAFSPTDVMPLTTRAKGLMALQAVAAFVTLALVISRAVSLLH